MATQAVAGPESAAPMNNGTPGGPTTTTATTTVDLATTPTYVAAHPKAKGHALSSFLKHGHPVRIDATFPSDLRKQTWQQKVSMVIVKFLWKIYPLLKAFGFVFEWTVNFFVLNNGPFSLLFKLIFFQWHKIVIPNPDADNYLSCVGQLDPRCSLFVDTSKKGKAQSTQADTLVFPDENTGSRSTADVLVMAAKVSYENPAVVRHVVEQYWKMHFVKFYNCWNEYQKMSNTQAFIFTDKPTDANAVVVAFRGTEAFNAYDWSTDLDFSWVNLEGLGRVHLGFLEALGLTTREDPSTFTKFRNKATKAHQKVHAVEQQEARSQHRPLSPHHRSLAEINQTTPASGLAEHIINSQEQSLAFDDITLKVAILLHDNPKAKLFVTGHSLGGALASLYAVMLHYTGQTEIASKLCALYTFGQPRIGDDAVKTYGNHNLDNKYIRVVYCNDLVPRVPFDDNIMSFKHFGLCAYFNSVYDGFTLHDEPNPNFFGVARQITMHLNALWEMFQGLIFITLQHGHEYQESTMSILFRALGLLLPGIASHSPTNYVNSVRLGPFPLRERIKGDLKGLKQEFRLMQDNVKDIIAAVFEEFMIILGLQKPKL